MATIEKSAVAKDTRRHHRKSRHGCAECKQRHIKCDEKKPRCVNCVQSRRHCSFIRLMPTIPVTTEVNDTPRSELSLAEFTLLPQSAEFSLMDCSLLHHFTVSTSRSLSGKPAIQAIWSTTVVRLAFRHKFLLHGLLAVSALHVAHTTEQDDRTLMNYAAEQQTVSLSAYTQAIGSPTEAQCNALFALSILTFVSTFAMSGDSPAEGAETIDFKWLRISRGIRTIVQAHLDEIRCGPLNAIIELEGASSPSQEAGDLTTHARINGEPIDFDSFSALWLDDPDLDLQEGEAKTHAEVLTYLQLAYTKTCVRLDGVYRKPRLEVLCTRQSRTEAFMWIFNVPQHYVELLEQHRPMALILLAHYAALLTQACSSWWSDQSSQNAIKTVQKLLDKKYHKWIETPVGLLQ